MSFAKLLRRSGEDRRPGADPFHDFPSEGSFRRAHRGHGRIEKDLSASPSAPSVRKQPDSEDHEPEIHEGALSGAGGETPDRPCRIFPSLQISLWVSPARPRRISRRPWMWYGRSAMTVPLPSSTPNVPERLLPSWKTRCRRTWSRIVSTVS